MMDSDLLYGVALLFLAVWLAYRGLRSLRRAGQNRRRELPATVQDKLPALGEPGTIARDQRRALKRLAIPQVDVTTLSREQAEILLDCVAYIQSVWESDLDRQMSDLSPALLDEALRIILDHESYRERVITWHQGLDDDLDVFVPDDACHMAVRFHLEQTA